MIGFTVKGKPIQWRRALTAGTKRFTDPIAAAYREQIRWTLRTLRRGLHIRSAAEGEVVVVMLRIYLQRPKRGAPDAPIRERDGDIDNFAKMFLDALQPSKRDLLSDGTLWPNDSQVCGVIALKCWAEPEKGEALPRADVFHCTMPASYWRTINQQTAAKVVHDCLMLKSFE